MCFKMIFGKAIKQYLAIEQLDMVIAFFNSIVTNGLLIYIEEPSDYKSLKDHV